MKKQKNPNVLTLKESRAITKSNVREMKRLEKLKRVKLTPDQYTTVMKSSENVLEIENLQTCFFTDSGVAKSVNGVTGAYFDAFANDQDFSLYFLLKVHEE